MHNHDTGQAVSGQIWRGAGITAALLGALLAALLAGGYGIWQLGAREQARETAYWQRQLLLIADSQAKDAAAWAEGAQAVVAQMADQAALRLYVQQLVAGGDVAEIEAQRQYLRNMLDVRAAEGGFVADPSLAPAKPQIGANLPRPPAPGLALLDADGRILLSTSRQLAHPKQLLSLAVAQPALAGPDATDAAPPMLRVAAPIFAVQADPGREPPIGYVYGARLLAPGLTATFAAQAATDAAGDSRLIRAAQDQRRHDVLSGTIAAADPVARWALAAGSGTAHVMDGTGDGVLAAAQAVSGTDWVVLRQVPAAQVLASVMAANRNRALMLGLALLAAAAAVLLIWRHGASLRVARLAEATAQARDRAAKTARFLQLVSDGQTMAIFALDGEDRVVFANRRAAEIGDADAESLIGKSLTAILGQAAAAPLARLVALARSRDEASSASLALALTDDNIRRGRADAVPLDAALYGGEANILLLWDDLTPLLRAHDRLEQTLEDAIAVLTGLIDARDPYSAQQSRRVAALGASVAHACDMDARAVRAVRVAGMLMNLGKLLVPRGLLTKAGPLSDEERARIHAGISRANTLVAQIDFDAPVAPTLLALPPGEQPMDDDAPATARLLVVVNAFVGMVSPRAHRQALAIDETLELLRQAPGRYDLRVISALSHVLDNQGWRHRVLAWQQGHAHARDF
ncbi:MAG: hypothetical protein Tsb0016_14860 [Sphingomonadales bacterium]